MVIEKIYLRAESGGEQIDCDRVRLVAGKGIEGDRYFGMSDEPGQNLTLIEATVVEEFLETFGLEHDLSISHRNLLVRGTGLNDLVGREFEIGGVRMRGVDFCHPFSGLGKALANDDISASEVVRFFTQRGGLRADILASGEIERGARLESLS